MIYALPRAALDCPTCGGTGWHRCDQIEQPSGQLPDEAFLRQEFERQHAGRNLKRHWMRGTYISANIAALWNQHFRTAKWLANRKVPRRVIVGIDPADNGTLAVAVHLREGDTTTVVYSQSHPANKGSIGAFDFIGTVDANVMRRSPFVGDDKRSDYSLKPGDTVYSSTWGGGRRPLVIADINWALRSVAVRTDGGAILVWPVAGLTRMPKE